VDAIVKTLFWVDPDELTFYDTVKVITAWRKEKVPRGHYLQIQAFDGIIKLVLVKEGKKLATVTEKAV